LLHIALKTERFAVTIPWGHPSFRTGRTRLASSALASRALRAPTPRVSSRTRLVPCALPMPRAAHRSLLVLAPPSSLALCSPVSHQRVSIRQQQLDEYMFATICFMSFQIYVAYVSSRYCKSRCGVAYVAMTIHVYYKFMFQTYVASVFI
jgi:hypothetical protein